MLPTNPIGILAITMTSLGCFGLILSLVFWPLLLFSPFALGIGFLMLGT